LLGTKYSPGTKVELVEALIPESSLRKPLTGNEAFRSYTSSLVHGKTVGGLDEVISVNIPSENILGIQDIGEVVDLLK
jgi:hypothetical protein